MIPPVFYDVRIVRDTDWAPQAAALRMRCTDSGEDMSLVVVHNDEHLPASADDGDAVDMFLVDDQGVAVSGRLKAIAWSDVRGPGEESTAWAADVRGLRGWIRLFASSTPEGQPLMVVDPPVAALHLAPPSL